MPHIAVSAIGRDRPGIVAAVTGVLVARGCNLEDTTMSILRGHFAMMLVVAVPDDLDGAALEAELSTTLRPFELVVAVRSIDDDVPAAVPGEAWTVSVYGADRPGIVHRVTTLLADTGVNIEDLTTRVIGAKDHPVYAMFLDVRVPESVDRSTFEADLDRIASELGISCSAHPADADIL